LEHIGVEIVEAHVECLVLFHQVGWWKFLQLFQCHSNEVINIFFSYFNGRIVYVGDLEIKLNLQLVATVTQLPLEGKMVVKKHCKLKYFME